ncbi:type I restriction endonuclease subunit R [Phocoenobacter atlanticus]|uniref:type I restriction endonuclease subunit R n=1 Tax=Phocoenobacter atlanticus TaxID=3416742 RepID=UPI00274D6820|nr:type I restriction endonuclease subunit R [Pasteurella atlantica]MDP8101513.1 type I restriction endonuclease subunit R [Pasteurella atlantica]
MKLNTPINEDLIEQLAIEQLKMLGWGYQYGKDIPIDEQLSIDGAWRSRGSQVVFKQLLKQALVRLNSDIPESVIDEVVQKICFSDSSDLALQNQTAYGWLRNGVAVSYQKEGEKISDVVRLIDFQNVANNDFLVVNQLTIAGRKGNRRPDVIAYINGLPIVVFELKNPLIEEADISKAYSQLQTYKDEITDLFIFNQVLVISDHTQARVGSVTADFDRFTPWRVVDEKQNSVRVHFENELESLLNGLFSPEILLDYIQNFMVFEKNEKGKIIKKIAAYHQYYGVNEAVQSTEIAIKGNKKIGVVWHTQGSGKSLSMLFYTGKVLSQKVLGNPTIVVVTDRNDLDGQLFKTFDEGKAILKQTPIQAQNSEELRLELAKREAGGVIFTTIQKFGLSDEEESHPVLNSRSNIIVITDEAHRSQYGFNQKINAQGQYRAGFAKHLRSALPNASFLGFTGTPIEMEDRDTQEVFGKYVSIYDFQDAVEDGATVPIIYEARQISLNESNEFDRLMREARDLLDDEDSPEFRLREKLMGTDERLDKLANDFIHHFSERNAVFEGKAMLVAMSRDICVKLYQKITALRPEWHCEDVNQGAIKIVMTSNASDPQAWQIHNQDKKVLEKRFKDPDDPLKVVIVRDMWLTGFDAPCCHTMYIDKPMKGHNLMQAIARVNRVFRNKSRENGGLIVDYVGLTEELREATANYTNANGKGSVKQDIDAIFDKMCEYISIIRGQFASVVDGKKFSVDDVLKITNPSQLLTEILNGANHIVGLDRVNSSPNDPNKKEATPRKKAFLEAVRLAKKGLSLCGALPQATPYKQELAFYDAVRATIIKNSATKDPKTGKNEQQLKLVSLINQAVTSDGVVDLFDLLGQERPNINLLSDEFLDVIRQSPTKDLWTSAIERYLKSKINELSGANLTTKADFEQRLKEAMNQYHNHNLSVLDIIEELIGLAKEFDEQSKRGQKLGLSEAELAFYDALAKNDSAKELMGDLTLIKLAREITDKLRKSATIDWQYKEGVKAKMRILVRRMLMIYKYPPDKQEDAIKYVLEQAEAIAEML